MKKGIKLIRNVILAFCCVTTLCVGVFVAANFSHIQKIAQTLLWIDNCYLWDAEKWNSRYLQMVECKQFRKLQYNMCIWISMEL